MLHGAPRKDGIVRSKPVRAQLSKTAKYSRARHDDRYADFSAALAAAGSVDADGSHAGGATGITPDTFSRLCAFSAATL